MDRAQDLRLQGPGMRAEQLTLMHKRILIKIPTAVLS
jgi:hypothetical protein